MLYIARVFVFQVWSELESTWLVEEEEKGGGVVGVGLVARVYVSALVFSYVRVLLERV